MEEKSIGMLNEGQNSVGVNSWMTRIFLQHFTSSGINPSMLLMTHTIVNILKSKVFPSTQTRRLVSVGDALQCKWSHLG